MVTLLSNSRHQIDMRPSVDIILPYHGMYELVTRCVSSIYSCTPNQNYNIILVDDGSPNPAYLLDITRNNRTKGIRLDKQSGFGAALAAGFAESSSPHIVFMHSDVQITNINWLINLQRGLNRLRDQDVKLVSARTNNPGTSASHHPSLVGQIGDEVEDTIVESALPLFCAYCHRDLFDHIGGFIRDYPYAWYEDEELFWRMKYYGYKQAIVKNSWVKHEGGSTIQEILTLHPKIRPIMENNRALCLEDIRPYLPQKYHQ